MWNLILMIYIVILLYSGVRPYKCAKCNKAFTQRCSLESHSKKVHSEEFSYQFKERRSKLYVCEQCGSVTDDPEKHFLHLKVRTQASY